MERTLAPVAQRRFTVEEYHRMAETGILGPDERVELVRGVVREVSPKSRAHVVATKRVFRLLDDALRGTASVYQEAPLVAESIDSAPEPDVLVCSSPDDWAYGTPRSAPVLVVEVADSSRGYDVGDKSELYADAAVPEYWVIDIPGRTLAVFRDPRKGHYELQFTLDEASRVSPEAWPNLAFEVSEFLPPQTNS